MDGQKVTEDDFEKHGITLSVADINRIIRKTVTLLKAEGCISDADLRIVLGTLFKRMESPDLKEVK